MKTAKRVAAVLLIVAVILLAWYLVDTAKRLPRGEWYETTETVQNLS